MVRRSNADDVATINVTLRGQPFGYSDDSATPEPAPEDQLSALIYWSAEKTWTNVYAEVTAAVARGSVRPTIYVPMTYTANDSYGQLPNYTIPAGNYPLAQYCFWDGNDFGWVNVDAGATLDDATNSYFSLYMRGCRLQTVDSLTRSGVTLDLVWTNGGGVKHTAAANPCFPSVAGFSTAFLQSQPNFRVNSTAPLVNLGGGGAELDITVLGGAAYTFTGSGSAIVNGTGNVYVRGDAISIPSIPSTFLGGSAAYVAGYPSVSVGARLPVYADGTRPTAANSGVGGIIYNTSDNAPNFSDGTNWRDAAGNIT